VVLAAGAAPAGAGGGGVWALAGRPIVRFPVAIATVATTVGRSDQFTRRLMMFIALA
jgi:hypothetical protein